MDEDGEFLELGGSRHRRVVVRVLAVLVLAGALAAYLVVQGGGGARDRRAAATSSRAPVSPAPASSAASSALPSPIRPPWPQRDGACGNTAFLPLVSAQPLHRRTGIRAVVGDRLTRVDVDTGTVTPVGGLPRGLFATAVATAADGTYALLGACGQQFGTATTVVRVAASGAVRTVGRGTYAQLLGGGDHIWAVAADADGNPTWLDPLDGSRRMRVPPRFGPVAAFGDLVVGTVARADAASDAPAVIRVLDTATGRYRYDLGPASAVTVSSGVIVWTPPNCSTCHLQVYDLATGRRTTTQRAVPIAPWLWSGTVSPDHRTVAFLRQSSRPAPYDMDHPGNPNEIVTLDLRTGAMHTVPGVTLWSKANPGLAFSADSRWLVIGLDEGTGIRLLVWRPGLSAPLESPARLASRVAYMPGLTTTV